MTVTAGTEEGRVAARPLHNTQPSEKEIKMSSASVSTPVAHVTHEAVPNFAQPAWATKTTTDTRDADGALVLTHLGAELHIDTINNDTGILEVAGVTVQNMQDIYITKEGDVETHRPVIGLFLDGDRHLTVEQALLVAAKLLRATYALSGSDAIDALFAEVK